MNRSLAKLLKYLRRYKHWIPLARRMMFVFGGDTKAAQRALREWELQQRAARDLRMREKDTGGRG